MRFIKLIPVLILILTNIATAEKPPITFDAIDTWQSVDGVAISNDGNYFVYRVNNGPFFNQKRNTKLVIQAVKNSWKMEMEGISQVAITEDSRKAVFIRPGAGLCTLILGTSSEECIPGVSSFRLFQQKGADQWLAYSLETPARELVVRNLATGKQRSFAAVGGYFVSPNGDVLLLQMELKKDETSAQLLQWVSLPGGSPVEIWQGGKAGSFIFDSSSAQLVFAVEMDTNQIGRSFWYYKEGMGKAVLLVNSQSMGVDRGLALDELMTFSKDGSRLFFTLQEGSRPAPKPEVVKVDVWSYTDTTLQSQQLKELREPRSYTAVINIQDRRIVRLQQDHETLILLDGFEEKPDDFTFITYRKGKSDEAFWSQAAQPSHYLVSTRDGKRRQMKMEPYGFFQESLSPSGKYLILWDDLGRNLYSYEITTGVSRNLTQGLPVPPVDAEYENPGTPPGELRMATWLEDETAVLLYDKYDIWQIDPEGKKLPVNVTNGYGRKHKIVFRLLKGVMGLGSNWANTIAKDKRLNLTAFNRNTKDSGFYAKTLGKSGDPELLAMGRYSYRSDPEFYLHHGRIPLFKARDAEVFVVLRGSATESFNFFSTSDFKTYTPLTAVYPETAYNWLTTELITWKSLDGRLANGVLYKPENFDPKKQYPVIFHYYETKSYNLNHYRPPSYTSSEIDIPWFVSNGYLVFTPDIHYTIGEPGLSAYNYVVSAAEHLAKFPWVNSKKMAIQGHSFGGYETNLLVTCTDIFAAAMSSSGISDIVSSYGAVMHAGGAPHGRFAAERGQTRIGATLWQRPDLFIKNSPVFEADKVVTPILMMSNKEDGVVNFSQGVEWFTALRRLGKKVWMLQYDDGVHTLGRTLGRSPSAAKDYTIRMTQFFDHYLKDAPAPRWMTEGIPARLKGIETGLELDMSGKVPGPGLLRQDEPAVQNTRQPNQKRK